jgi:hypothetical protein
MGACAGSLIFICKSKSYLVEEDDESGSSQPGQTGDG